MKENEEKRNEDNCEEREYGQERIDNKSRKKTTDIRTQFKTKETKKDDVNKSREKKLREKNNCSKQINKVKDSEILTKTNVG